MFYQSAKYFPLIFHLISANQRQLEDRSLLFHNSGHTVLKIFSLFENCGLCIFSMLLSISFLADFSKISAAFLCASLFLCSYIFFLKLDCTEPAVLPLGVTEQFCHTFESLKFLSLSTPKFFTFLQIKQPNPPLSTINQVLLSFNRFSFSSVKKSGNSTFSLGTFSSGFNFCFLASGVASSVLQSFLLLVLAAVFSFQKKFYFYRQVLTSQIFKLIILFGLGSPSTHDI